jgi:hypothetical protein
LSHQFHEIEMEAASHLTVGWQQTQLAHWQRKCSALKRSHVACCVH